MICTHPAGLCLLTLHILQNRLAFYEAALSLKGPRTEAEQHQGCLHRVIRRKDNTYFTNETWQQDFVNESTPVLALRAVGSVMNPVTPSISGRLLGYRSTLTRPLFKNKKRKKKQESTHSLDIHDKISSNFTEVRICMLLPTPPVPLLGTFSSFLIHSFLTVLCSLMLSLSCHAKIDVNNCIISV